MKKYSEFAPTGFDCRGLGLPDQQNWLVAPVSRTRDSGPLDESNFECALAQLGGESEDVQIHRFSHWGPCWFEIILINPERRDLVSKAEEIEASLEDYPVLDDEDHSRREWEAYEESWDAWGRDEYTTAIRIHLFKVFPDGVSEDYSDAEIEAALDEFRDFEIDELRDKASEKMNWLYQSGGDGITINIRGLVEDTDFGRVADLAKKTCRQKQRTIEITKLALACGATPDQAKLAVQKDLDRVTLIKAFVAG